MPPYDANTDNEANRLSTVMMSNAQAAVDQFRQDYQQFPANGANLLNATTDHVADRVSNVMMNNPDLAADQLRADLQVLDPQTGSSLIAKIKNDETYKTSLYGAPGLGDLQIQPEIDQNGNDTGFRNVTMATPEGIQQIAEIQARPLQPQDPGYGYGAYGQNTLGFAAGMIVGDLMWQNRMGMNFDDDRYRGWCNREMGREQYWQQNQSQFQANWNDPNYRSQFEGQRNWQQINNSTTINNSYVNNRIDTTTINRPVTTTIINETINNNHRAVINPHQPITYPTAGRPIVGGQGGEIQSHPAPIVHPGTTAGAPMPGRVAPIEQTPVRPSASPVERTAPPALQQEQQAREAAARQQQEQQAREAAARQQQEQQAREAAARQQQEQQAREAAARQQQELQAHEAAARQQQEQQQHEAAARQQQEQQQHEAAARQQQEQQQHEAAARQQQEQQQHTAAPTATPRPAESAPSHNAVQLATINQVSY